MLNTNEVANNPEAVMGKPEPKEEVKEIAFDIQTLLLEGYVTKEFKKKAFNYKLRTLKNEEVMEIYTKLGKASLVSKAHADSSMELLFVGASVVSLNGVVLEDVTKYPSIPDYLDARVAIVKTWPGTMTDIIYGDYTALNRELSEFLATPEEIVKN